MMPALAPALQVARVFWRMKWGVLWTDRISSFNDQEISNCLLAFAKMEHVDVNVLRVCNPQLETMLPPHSYV